MSESELERWVEREKKRLQTELAFYAAHKNDWLEKHSSEYVVVQDHNLLGFYPSFETAFRAGVGAFGGQRDFLVKQVLARDPIYFVG
jgi:hypothetical protein